MTPCSSWIPRMSWPGSPTARSRSCPRCAAVPWSTCSSRTRPGPGSRSRRRPSGWPLMGSTSRASVTKGESLKDTALTLEAMGADAVVVRHSASGAPHRLAGWVRGSVINAGDGAHEHPTQALLDAFTIRRPFGRGAGAAPGSGAGEALDGLRVTIVGDVLHSRVARSNVWLLHTLGAEVALVAPPTLLPVAIGQWPATVSYDLDSALPKSDVVMMLRVQ